MPKRDFFHDAVRKALEAEGWTVTDDPLRIQVGDINLFIDLGAERVIGAQKGGEEIAVEVKSFVGQAAISVFHEALGQYKNYLFALEETHSKRDVYIAIPYDSYTTFFSKAFIQKVIKRESVKLIVYDPSAEKIVLWIK